ncbi:hypothetical protein COCSADRAFT_192355 [Bipolaris sorokiniana ND90Pr]|uniref:Nephrocystin 3-like N-terminal domain-containing protein n=1 Tax=Cochliobolus sativus (strain ND90Pr / ATCC 201652) TaxID=665912 RepID=M2SG34_COCSN|nr:uncharacterized protein COCSADRAFT_192355 [Bipolaris sorokiniana ND90Pr]EMD61400.1 hypothetical protein COCSADRAFT_192355 [Bipolaris sorokiniana ND90Pr]
MAEYQQAHTEFLAQLSDEEKKQFIAINDSQSFLAAIQDLQKFRKSNRRWVKLLSCVQRCGDCLQPYFDVVGTVVQSHPEVAAVAWGSFRLVLLECHPSFFSKKWKYVKIEADRIKLLSMQELRKTPAVIGSLLWTPFNTRFANILQRLDSHRGILRFEIDLLQLSTSDKIADNQDTIQYYQSQIEKHVQHHITTLSAMNVEFTSQKHNFADALELMKQKRLEGTAEWIFQTKEFLAWANSNLLSKPVHPMANFLWIRGNPGTGKSVLAASVVEEMLENMNYTTQLSPIVAYYFFEYNSDKGKATARDKAYRAILGKLFHQFSDNRDVLEIFSFAMFTKRRHGQATATNNELLDIMKTVANHVGDWTIIIDAVDECEEEETLLQDFSETFGDIGVRVLLLSRPDVQFLRRKLPSRQVVTIDRSHNLRDLEHFFETHLSSLKDLNILPASASVDEMTRNLVKGADGMFQWAQLMIIHLKSKAFTPWQRLDIIKALTTPEKLEDMYVRILEHLSEKPLSEQSLARRIFGWLTFAERPLTTIQLQDVLTPLPKGELAQVPKGITLRPKEEEFTDFESSVIILSGSLIEKRAFPNLPTIYVFIHLSVREFFRSRCDSSSARAYCQTGSIDYFLPAAPQIQAELARQCLEYIVWRIPAAPLSGNILDPVCLDTLNQLRPFISYATLQWPRHLINMGVPGTMWNANPITGFRDIIEKLTTILARILLNRLLPMVWVELKYTFEKRSDAHDALHTALLKWSQWIQSYDLGWLPGDSASVPPAIIAFAEDLSTLHQFWGDTLVAGPHHIWQDVTAFTSSPFFVTTGAVAIKSLVSERSHWSGRSSVPLSKISRDDPKTDFLATLTIWPSSDIGNKKTRMRSDSNARAFEAHWRPSASRAIRTTTEDIFDEWIAQYELWNIEFDDPILVEDYRIVLDKIEVQSQHAKFQKFIKTDVIADGSRKTRRELAVHFPTSISGDLRTITVLTTVFDCQQRLVAGTSTKQEAEAVEMWNPTPLPIRHTKHATLLMGLPKEVVKNKQDFPEQICNESFKEKIIRLDSMPAYRLLTCRDYVLLQGIDGRGTLNEEDDMTSSMAVYWRDVRHLESPKLVGCITGDGSVGSILHPTFHPQYPLIAFHYKSQIGDSHIVLWLFKKPGDEIVLLNHDIFSFRSLEGGLSACYVTKLASRIKMLQFSACGTTIIHQLYENASLFTKSIEDLHVYNVAKQQHESGKVKVSSQSFGSSAPRQTAVQKMHSLPGSMATNEPVQHTDGSVTSLAFDAGASNRAIKLVHSANGRNHEQALLSLPAWSDVHNISASVRLPERSRDERIMIVLNKTAEPFYIFGRGAGPTAPSIVRKDIKALAKPRSTDIMWGERYPKANTTTSWKGITFGDETAAEGDMQITKRARLS